jgi:hypothetical protein
MPAASDELDFYAGPQRDRSVGTGPGEQSRLHHLLSRFRELYALITHESEHVVIEVRRAIEITGHQGEMINSTVWRGLPL